ncbi:MAG: class I SAM-dependent methyltransferase [Chloroflexota bacterium]|nr:class I SAM-dependent methyltransferase [Chloroflexota bacterium]
MSDATFARYFDAQYRTFEEDLPLWLHLAAEHGGPIIELGCGTGRVVQALIRAEHHVIGLDIDRHMLARAQNNISHFSLQNSCLVQADIQTFAFGVSFNLAIASMNTLSTFDDPGLMGSFVNISGQLAPGGILAFEISNPAVDSLKGIDPDEPLTAFVEPESRNPCQVYAQRIEGPAQDQVEILWHYDELFADGSTQRYTLRRTYFLRSKEKVQEFLDRANYTVVEAYGDYDRSPLEEDSETMIIVARANQR